MKIRLMLAALAGAALISGAGQAQMAPPLPTVPMLAPAGSHKLSVHVDALKSKHLMPDKYAFCAPAAQGHMGAGPDISPAISWSKGPKGTLSYAIILYDTDSPAEQREKMNQEGMTVPATAKRQIFYHWLLVDIPANVNSLPEGAESQGRVPHGKPAADAKVGVRGTTTYSKIFAANEAMKGDYYGYDGPCPPWNDENTHHYHFTVYALSVKSLGLSGPFDSMAAQAAMQGKVLAQGEFLGYYSTNPAVIAKLPK